jgi:hypothetical protein
MFLDSRRENEKGCEIKTARKLLRKEMVKTQTPF